jgi:hypothetical protein
MPGTRCLRARSSQQPLAEPSAPAHVCPADRARPRASCQGRAVPSCPSHPPSAHTSIKGTFPVHFVRVAGFLSVGKSPPCFPCSLSVAANMDSPPHSPSLCVGHWALLSPSAASRAPGVPPSSLVHRRTIAAPVRSASTPSPSSVRSRASSPCHANVS